MSSSFFCRFFCLCIAWVAGLQGLAAGEEESKSVNIIFLLVDDQRNDTLGCAGHPIVKTPVIDQLASAGVRFSNAFVTTSICAASRASIFTGLHERTHGYTFGTPPVGKTYMLQSYPSLMKQAGYRTGFIGKYGIATEGKVEAGIFDFYKPHGRNPYFKKLADGQRRHETELAGDRAIEFLNGHPKEHPFCLSISFNAAHAEDGDKQRHYPWPKAVDGMYEGIEIPAPRLSDPTIFESQPDFLKNSMNRQRYFWRWDTPEKYQRNMKAYFRMISGIDHVIGRIRQHLEKLDLADNTVIVYMGDNGYYMGNRGFAGKWSHYEESLRIPLIIYDPRLSKEQRGKVCEQIALNIDIPSTMLDLAGVAIPQHYQGQSLKALMAGAKVSNWREDFLCEHLMRHKNIPKWEGVRGARYTYARYVEQQPVYEFLYDLQSDPDQLHNLASQPGHRDILSTMSKRCDALKKKYQGAKIK